MNNEEVVINDLRIEIQGLYFSMSNLALDLARNILSKFEVYPLILRLHA